MFGATKKGLKEKKKEHRRPVLVGHRLAQIISGNDDCGGGMRTLQRLWEGPAGECVLARGLPLHSAAAGRPVATTGQADILELAIMSSCQGGKMEIVYTFWSEQRNTSFSSSNIVPQSPM